MMHEFTLQDASREHLGEGQSDTLMMRISLARRSRSRIYTMPVPSFPGDTVQYVFVTKSKDIICSLARIAEAEGGSGLNLLAASIFGEMAASRVTEGVAFPDDNPDVEGWLFVMTKEDCRSDEPHGHKARIRFFVSK
jgi:hypothetical protein